MSDTINYYLVFALQDVVSLLLWRVLLQLAVDDSPHVRRSLADMMVVRRPECRPTPDSLLRCVLAEALDTTNAASDPKMMGSVILAVAEVSQESELNEVIRTRIRSLFEMGLTKP